MKPITPPTSPAVPLLDLKAQYAAIRAEVQAAVLRVIESQHFILGPEVEQLEAEIARCCQCQYAIGVSSGTDALLVALMAIGLKPGDEVITTPYTFFATAGAVARLGATPVFVDIDPATYNIAPEHIQARISPKTRAIIPVHLFGQMAEMDPIMEIATRHRLYVIEDAAQAIGAEYHGRRAGSIGHLGCLSFFPSKNLGAFGDAGMVTTNDPELADRVRLLRNHGYRPKYYNKVIGGNFRLDTLQAAVLRVKLQYLETWTEARRRNAECYRRLFSEAGLVDASGPSASPAPGKIVLPVAQPHCRHVYNQFVIRTAQDQRPVLHQQLREAQIGHEVYYPLPLHLQECFAHLGYRPGDLPESEAAAAQTTALPVYAELSPAQQATVVHAVARALTAQG